MSTAGVGGRQADGSSDRRWIVLATDGRYSNLGRAVDPTEDAIRLAEEALRSEGLGGYLAVMSGSAHAAEVPTFLEVRPLASPTVTFAAAVASCLVEIQKGG